MAIIWCMVPAIPSAAEIIFCHFAPFFTLLPPNNPKNQNFEKLRKISGSSIILYMCTIKNNHVMYGSWDMEHDTEFVVILDLFLTFYPRNNPKNQNFEKKKKDPGDIIILNKCTINDNHMIYCSLHMKHVGLNFLLFWTVFFPFIPLTTRKN